MVDSCIMDLSVAHICQARTKRRPLRSCFTASLTLAVFLHNSKASYLNVITSALGNLSGRSHRCHMLFPLGHKLTSSLAIIIRCLQHSCLIACDFRVQLTDLSCFAFLYGRRQEHVQYIAELCNGNAELLRKYPLYFFALLSEELYACWIE